ncbi:hypothetical protein ACGFJT_20635 [Actinomadura geliboluensis]|uniref:hypothetical protein n=1 Tax=Actinomadura geliboluensis TaxID=882440 RepID=UPI003720647B
MRADDITGGFAEDGYIARQTWRSNLPVLVILGAVDVFVLYQTVRRPGLGAGLALMGFGGITVLLGFFVMRSVHRGEVSFAVDARGVYFGYSGKDVEPERIPWSWIDCVVTFNRIVHRGGLKGYVGVELNAAGVTARMNRLPRPAGLPPPTAEEAAFNEALFGPWLRRLAAEPSLVSQEIQGWRLDKERLAEAVMRHSPGTPIARRPTRRDPGIVGIAATAWQVRKNLQQFGERDDHRDDDDR